MTLGEYLKSYRKRMGLSQRAFAQKCNVSHAYIGFLEKGVNPSTGEPIKPTLNNLHKIANGMEVPLDDIISLVDSVILDTGDPIESDQIERVLIREQDSLENYLIQLYRDMKPDGKQRLLEQAAILYEKYKKEDSYEA